MAQAALSETKKVLMKKTLGVVKDTITKYFDLDDLFKKTRKRKYIDARLMFVKYSYEKIINKSTGKNLFKKSEIAAYMNLDHATILHSLKKFDNLCFSDLDYRNEWESLLKKIDRKILLAHKELELQDELINYIELSNSATKTNLLQYIVKSQPSLKDIFEYSYDLDLIIKEENVNSTIN